jgi:hypothetical protein
MKPLIFAPRFGDCFGVFPPLFEEIITPAVFVEAASLSGILRKRQLRSQQEEALDLVAYLEDHISEMSEENLLKLSAVHGTPTTDRRIIAERAAMLHFKRWRAA